MTTNEERKKIVKRLRYVAEHGAPEWATTAYCIADCFSVEYHAFNGSENLFAAIADLIEPEPERTCRNVSDRYDVFTCSVCKANVLVEDHIGYIMWTGEKYTNKLEFCPNCGAKVCTE